ncbi:DUF523 and DUF1722 domain-containing protein [Acidaminobacter sp. JC074]|uniref:YbgA family protein n=1 Tax=Acidaminobacter sp. JC074 TaxID=2530199 RepID=UPI001F1111CF|nr:DUF523 and DUF1722 domain-containing protein [Acidaminobacter sp. JC074]MCH4890433.1 DUF523 and DUF1722 domain-containing protein [Acidaminobacter sp. JC074]
MNKKPRILISKCLEHGHCRYDGGQIASPFIKRIKEYVDIVTVCPEVEIGLGVPREAIRVIKSDADYRLVHSLSGGDVTERMNDFSREFVQKLDDQNWHGFILKNKSPTCGIKDVKVYKSFGKSMSIDEKTSGFFSRHVSNKYVYMPIEDEGRLSNYSIRDHFLTSIFTLSRYDDVKEKETMKDLIDFHRNHKYLLMAYHQKYQKDLGKIVANQAHCPISDVIKTYEGLLKKALIHPLKRGTNINMLMHLFGYFKKELSSQEKAFFLEMLDQYKDMKVPFSVPLSLIYVWVIRFDETYLKDQVIFNPYPREILDVTDSGKGIK